MTHEANSKKNIIVIYSLMSYDPNINRSTQLAEQTFQQLYKNANDFATNTSTVLNLEKQIQQYQSGMNTYQTQLSTYQNDISTSANTGQDNLIFATDSVNNVYYTDPYTSSSSNTSTWQKTSSGIVSVTCNADGSLYIVKTDNKLYKSTNITHYDTMTLLDNTQPFKKVIKASNGMLFGITTGGNLLYVTGQSSCRTTGTSNWNKFADDNNIFDICFLPVASYGNPDTLFAIANADRKKIFRVESNYTTPLGPGNINGFGNPSSTTDTSFNGFALGYDNTLYSIQSGNKLYKCTNYTGTSGWTWTLISKPAFPGATIQFITVCDNILQLSVNQDDFYGINRLNEQMIQKNKAIQSAISSGGSVFDNYFKDEQDTKHILDMDYDQLLDNRREIDDLIHDYNTADKDQQNSVTMIEKNSMQFRIFFIIFVLMFIYFVRSIARRSNPMMNTGIGLPNNNMTGDRILYLVTLLLLLFSMNFFKSTFGFFLMCILTMVAVFIMSGVIR